MSKKMIVRNSKFDEALRGIAEQLGRMRHQQTIAERQMVSELCMHLGLEFPEDGYIWIQSIDRNTGRILKADWTYTDVTGAIVCVPLAASVANQLHKLGIFATGL